MSKILKHVTASVVTIAVLAFVFVLAQTVTAQGGTQNSLLTQDGGALDKFQITQRNYTADNLKDLSENIDLQNNNPFRLFGDVIFDDVTVGSSAIFRNLDKNSRKTNTIAALNIGYPGVSSTPNLATLQIDGDVQVSSVGTQLGNETYCLCANADGSLVKCGIYDPANGETCKVGPPEPELTYDWVISGWGQCVSPGTQTRTVVCEDNLGSTVTDTNCTTAKPAESQSCTLSQSSCQGTYFIDQQIINKVDWDGNSFGWSTGTQYETGYTQCRIYSVDSCSSSSCSWSYEEYTYDAYDAYDAYGGFNGDSDSSGLDPTCGYDIDQLPISVGVAGVAGTPVDNYGTCPTQVDEQTCLSQQYDGCTWQ